jgi:hypothetical protein
MNYNTVLPSLDGVISDDCLYFEGVHKPLEVYTIRDREDPNKTISKNEIDVLEKYFNDVYNLFLRKLSSFASIENSSSEDTMKMQALLQELIKVKNLINKGV